MTYVPHHVLQRHVLESNLIEGIRAASGSPFHDSHLRAAQLAASGRFVSPAELHAMLGTRVPGLERYAGKHRSCEVAIGSVRALPNGRVLRVPFERVRHMPQAVHVPRLLADWESLVVELLGARDVSRQDRGNMAHFMHAWLLCIHPFEDGNGRVARLVWNNLRICLGLPWHVQRASHKGRYYARIRAIEERDFRSWYPEVYL